MFLRIALRSLRRHTRRTILTGLMMVGGYALVSFTVGMMDGSYGYIIDLFTREHTGHLQIHTRGYLDKPSIYEAFEDSPALRTAVTSVTGVRAIAPRIRSAALGFIGTRTTGVSVFGIDPLMESRVTTLAKKVKTGRFLTSNTDPGVVVGAGIHETLKAKLGDEIILISQGADGSIANQKYRIVGFLADGIDSAERLNVYMTIPAAQQFLSLGSRIHEIAVLSSSIKTVDETALLITRAIQNPKLSVETWKVVEEDFCKMMRQDYQGNYVFYFIIMFLVAIGVLNTVSMSIVERTREFGLMRALGDRPGRVFALIVLETTLLSIFSSLIGGAIGLAANYYFSVHGIRYPAPIDIGSIRFEYLFTDVNPTVILYPTLLTIGISILVSLYPALRASKIRPVDALRFT